MYYFEPHRNNAYANRMSPVALAMAQAPAKAHRAHSPLFNHIIISKLRDLYSYVVKFQ